jgi:hypothetical protein
MYKLDSLLQHQPPYLFYCPHVSVQLVVKMVVVAELVLFERSAKIKQKNLRRLWLFVDYFVVK